MKYPYGITINELNGDIFACDKANDRVQIFFKDFLFKSQFGKGILQCPSDIKLTNEYIYVLSYTDPFLYSFNYNLTQVQNAVLSSISKHLTYSFSFCIDGAGNFITSISDNNQNAIVVFKQGGDLVHKITDNIQEPCGVILDAKGRIILVGYNNRLLIF